MYSCACLTSQNPQMLPQSSIKRHETRINGKKRLQGLYWSHLADHIVFHFRNGHWDVFESLAPFTIQDAFERVLKVVEEAVPGTLAKATELDDANWMKPLRKRRYIAENLDVLYIS